MRKSKLFMAFVLMGVSLLPSQSRALTLDRADWACVNAEWTTWNFINDGWGEQFWTGYILGLDTIKASSTPCRSYIKFSMVGDPNFIAPEGKVIKIDAASLFLHNARYSYGPGAVQWADDGVYAVANDMWTQAGMNYVNKPAFGELLEQQEYVGNYTVSEFNSEAVRAYVEQEANGDKVVTFGVADIGAVYTAPEVRAAHGYYATSNYLWMVVDFTFVDKTYDIGDLNKDDNVNLADFAMFAAEWMTCIDPVNINCGKPWE